MEDGTISSEPAASGSHQPLISVIVPVFNEKDVLPELHERLRAALADLPDGYEAVYVDDGSTDGSAEIIERWAQAENNVVLVQLSRNFGMEIAMSAGLDHARAPYVVLMHADLQDPPELIPDMLNLATVEQADVVFAQRIGRDESRIKRLLATGFYATMRRLARVPYQGQAGDFRLMSRRVVDTVRSMPERRRFLRGMVAWVGFKQVPIEYRRAGRRAGGGASYPALFRLSLEAVTSFSDVPLSLATYIGALSATVSALAGSIVLLLTLLGALTASTSVWILVAVLFLGGVQLMSVGVLGRYLAHVHDQVLERPLYLVERVVSRGSSTATRPPRAARAAEPQVAAAREPPP
jgi:glycosyltransferase involved in cell wall biosynthesis